MPISIPESGSVSAAGRTPAAPGSSDTAERIAQLTERQCSYLRLVQQNRNSKEIAAIVGASYRAVDKQLMKANYVLGATTRFEAARMFTEHETGVGCSYPANDLPSPQPMFPLPSVLPNAETAANMLTWKQAVIWTAIISIVTPIGLTVAGMAVVTLMFLLGSKTP